MKKLIFCVIVLTTAVVCVISQSQTGVYSIPTLLGSEGSDDEIQANSELIVAFVVFRHGDRTPDQEELNYYPAGKIDDKHFYPYGKKALTIKGKQRGYLLGENLRKRYNDSIDQIYLPNEISVRTTDYARTKMTALTALAALYPPTPLQQWNPNLNWQPIPYDTMSSKEDDMLYFTNCPRYYEIKNSMYEVPEIQEDINSYESLYQLLTAHTGKDIRTPDDVFQLDNLFQALENVGLPVPEWAQNVMPQIKNVTKIEYLCSYYTKELRRLAAGVLLGDIIHAAKATIAGISEQPKLRLYSGHEINVAALLAALKVFSPHQPKYGSAVFLELRKSLDTGKMGWTVTYAPETGGPGVVLPIADCGGEPLCDYDKFISLHQDLILSRSEYRKECDTRI